MWRILTKTFSRLSAEDESKGLTASLLGSMALKQSLLCFTVVNLTWPQIETLSHRRASCKQLHLKKRKKNSMLLLAFAHFSKQTRSLDTRQWRHSVSVHRGHQNQRKVKFL